MWVIRMIDLPAHLLCKHDDAGCNGGTAYTRDGEQLDETIEEGATADHSRLDFKLAVDVVHVARGLRGTKQSFSESAKKAKQSLALTCISELRNALNDFQA